MIQSLLDSYRVLLKTHTKKISIKKLLSAATQIISSLNSYRHFICLTQWEERDINRYTTIGYKSSKILALKHVI